MQFHFEATEDQVVVAAYVCSWGSCFCPVDAGLESFRDEDVVYLVVRLLIWGVPSCSSRCFMRVQSAGQSHVVLLSEFQEAFASFVGFSYTKPSSGAMPHFIGVRANFCIPVSLNNQEVFLWRLLYYGFYVL